MRRLFPLVHILIAMIAVASVALAQGEAKPKAVPLEPTKDFEIVTKGDVIKHAFQIRNDGDAPLRLTDVRPACGCTVAKYDKVIAPGKVGNVNVKVETENFDGPISKSIAVFTNDTATPKLQLVVKAKVQPYIAVMPGFARFNYVRGEETGTISQTLWAEDGANFKVLSVKSPYDYLSVDFHEATEEERNPEAEGRQWRVDVAIQPDARVGVLRDYVEIALDHPQQKLVKIPVSGFVRPRQHVTPQEADFGQLQGETLPLQRTFHFTNFIGTGIEVKEVDTGFDAITAKVIPSKQETGHRFQLVLTIGPDMPKGKFDGKVKIHTTDERNPVVELPIQGIVL